LQSYQRVIYPHAILPNFLFSPETLSQLIAAGGLTDVIVSPEIAGNTSQVTETFPVAFAEKETETVIQIQVTDVSIDIELLGHFGNCFVLTPELCLPKGENLGSHRMHKRWMGDRNNFDDLTHFIERGICLPQNVKLFYLTLRELFKIY